MVQAVFILVGIIFILSTLISIKQWFNDVKNAYGSVVLGLVVTFSYFWALLQIWGKI